MEKKNMMIIAAVVILAIVIVVGFIFISGNSNDSSKGSTSFSSPFNHFNKRRLSLCSGTLFL